MAEENDQKACNEMIKYGSWTRLTALCAFYDINQGRCDRNIVGTLSTYPSRRLPGNANVYMSSPLFEELIVPSSVSAFTPKSEMAVDHNPKTKHNTVKRCRFHMVILLLLSVPTVPRSEASDSTECTNGVECWLGLSSGVVGVPSKFLEMQQRFLWTKQIW